MAAPPARLFANTAYGVSVWAWFVLECYAYHRPLRAVARALATMGIPIAPGTLADAQSRLLGVFEPVEGAIAERQRTARLVQGDETRWMIHVRGERGENPRCWLWLCLSEDAVRMHIDPTRSARAARVLFSLFATLALAGINRHHWLLDCLHACASNAGEAPAHLDPWLPWAMDDDTEKSATPAKPTLEPVPGSSTSLAASWRKPGLNGGPEITGYKLEYRQGSGNWQNFPHGDTAETTTITGLMAETEYQVRVQAENGEGDSDWSDPSDAVRTNAVDIPIPPGLEVTLHLSDDALLEDDGRATLVTATVSPASPVAFTVTISADPVAPATEDDFELSNKRVLRFAADATESTGTVTIRPVDDDAPEPHDVVTVSGSVSNAAIPDPDDVALTIRNDDADLPQDVAIDAPAAVEEDAGTAAVTVTITTRQNSAPTIDVDLHYRWQEGTATRGEDYTAKRGTVTFAPGRTRRTVRVPVLRDGEAEDAETVVLRLSNARSGGSQASVDVTVAQAEGTIEDVAPEAPSGGLTARFARAPSEHDGRAAFTLRIAFNETIRMSGRRLRGDVVAVSGGRATKARAVNGRKDRWDLTVKPASLADVAVTLAGGAACDTPEAVCTTDGKALSHTLSTTVRGPVTVSVADARAREGEDETIDFAVSLSRAAAGAVSVTYATADGSARSGSDYTARKGKLRFAPGETEKTISVPVLDDAHDEGAETMRLRLSAASGAVIADGVATGTIENTDHMPAAWLARFGRTVTDQVLDAVEARLAASRAAGARVRLAGQALPSWDAGDRAKTAANDADDAGADASGRVLRADASGRVHRSEMRSVGDRPVVADQVAGGNMVVAEAPKGWCLCMAARLRERAAGGEAAPYGWVDWARRIALEADALATPLGRRVGRRHRRQQGPGIGMARVREQGHAVRLFDNLAQVHDRDLAAEVLHHSQVMGDEQVGQVEIALQVAQQVDDLCLNGDIESRHRLIAHDQIGLTGQRPRDPDSLTLAARKLVRKQGQLLRP